MIVTLPVGSSLVFATVMVNVCVAEDAESAAVMVTLSAPTSASRGVPAKEAVPSELSVNVAQLGQLQVSEGVSPLSVSLEVTE